MIHKKFLTVITSGERDLVEVNSGKLKLLPLCSAQFTVLHYLFWRRKWQPTPVFLPWKFHGLRSLVGYSPWGRKESDTTEQLHYLFYNQIKSNQVKFCRPWHRHSHICLKTWTYFRPTDVDSGVHWKNEWRNMQFFFFFFKIKWFSSAKL